MKVRLVARVLGLISFYWLGSLLGAGLWMIPMTGIVIALLNEVDFWKGKADTK